MNGLIYKATFPSGKCYIGKTTNINRRKNEHKNSSLNEKYNDYDCLFHHAIRKYGFDTIVWDILYDKVPEDLLNIAEICAIYIFDSYGKNGYNMTEGGDSPPSALGRILSKEHKEKISKANKGKRKTEEQKKQQSEKLKGRISNRKGIRLSEETKQKISASHKGKKRKPKSKELREKISIMMKERWKNKELMKKYLTNGKPRKKWTEEEKKQYAEKLKGKKRGTYKNKGRSLSEEHKEKLRGKRSNNGI